MRKPDRRHGLAAALRVALLCALAGCAAPVNLVNRPLAPGRANPVAGALDWPPDRPFILMSFSGGGSRAAALAMYTLAEMRSHGDGTPGHNLTDDIAVISSVSGGSVTAAYFGLYGADNLGALERNFLARDNMQALELQGANPITIGRLLFGGYSRVDALRDLLDRQLFFHRTFADMARANHAHVILNATDMASGEVFAFTPERFNQICSDLSVVPVSVGVSASAAFPILLSPVDLQDFHYPACPGNPPAEPWIAADMGHVGTRYLDLDEYESALYANALQHGSGAFRDIRYLHLLDGGLADNLGVHSLMEVITSPHGSPPVLRAINEGKIRRLVVITVRARSVSPSPLYRQASTPGLTAMATSVADDPIDSATSSIAAQQQALLDRIASGASAASRSAGFGGLSVYPIEIDVEQLLPGQDALKWEVETIPTSWTVSAAQLASLHSAAALLLEQHPCFRKLLVDLGQAPPEAASQAGELCSQPQSAPPPRRPERLSFRRDD